MSITIEEDSLIFDVDSYKASHWLQYPPGTTSVFSYIESRGGKYDKTVFFGLQYQLKRYLTQRVTNADVEEAKRFFADHGEPFNEEGWKHIVSGHDGYLPLRIRAVTEGSVVPTGNILVSVENTCPHCFWLTSWVETQLLRVWYPITVATTSWNIKRDIKRYLEKTADDPENEILYKLHDFGGRGVSSRESAMIGGMAHLVNFRGSDTVPGVRAANKYYNVKMAATSIPAGEHASYTCWGRDHEVDAYRNMLKHFAKPGAMLACVSDSFDIYNACTNIWGGELRQEVIDSGAIVIIRPDSGTPHLVVKECLLRLDEKFGHTVNSKGYKVLNHVRIIQGDGINRESICQILDTITAMGYSATNVSFGMGGALLQQMDRDTQKFAMKCSHIACNGISIDVFKDPVTDPGKKSKPGRLDLILENGEFVTVRIPEGKTIHPRSIMNTVLNNGCIVSEVSLEQVRVTADAA